MNFVGALIPSGSGEYCKSCFSLVVVVAPGTKGFVSFAFLDARSVGLKLGQNMKKMCMRYVAKSKKQGIQRRRFHFMFDSIIFNYQWTRNAKKEESMIKLGIPGK